VTTSPEAIGRLLADSTLMRGERELLRKRDEPAAEAGKSGAQNSAPPLSHDSKAVAAVLLTLLDERLQASDAALMGQGKAAAGPGAINDAVASSGRVVARYAEDGLAAISDPARPEIGSPNAQVPMRDVPPTASPDLQTFLQRLAAFASGRSIASGSTAGRSDRGGKAPMPFSASSIFRIAGTALALWYIAAIIVDWASR
jgi:hypothetical protein